MFPKQTHRSLSGSLYNISQSIVVHIFTHSFGAYHYTLTKLKHISFNISIIPMSPHTIEMSKLIVDHTSHFFKCKTACITENKL